MRALPMACGAILLWCAAASAQPKPGETFKDCGTCPEMVVLPGGTAMLGGEPWEQDARASWGRLREVTIAYGFAVAKTEVTRAQYREFVTATKYASPTTSCNTWGFTRILGQTDGYTWDNPGHPQREDAPVVCVSWEDATAFVAWLAARTGKPYRLLSSSEFEYANVADDTYRRLYSYGPVFACNDNWERLAPVASFKANPFGLHDMLGNAWEWTDDCYHEDMAGVPTDGRPWLAEDGGNCKARTPRAAYSNSEDDSRR
jgi:formylglycine-generating enzyme required for sulfatase activity